MITVNVYTPKEFLDFDSVYWGLGSIKNEIYIALCSHDPHKSAALFSFNRKSKKINKILSLSQFIRKQKGSFFDGKIHTPIFSKDNNELYFATHFVYPYGKPQKVKYKGGHIIKYSLKTKTVEDLGIPIKNNGVITMILDKKRLKIYGLSAPSHNFFTFDITSKKTINLGKISNGSICRSLVLDNIGNVYGAYEKNKIFKFDYKKTKIIRLKTHLIPGKNKIKEWIGKSRGGVNYIGRNIWRSAIWHNQSKKIYGIHATNSTLFNFD